MFPARPLDFNGIRGRIRPEPERQREIACGAVARSAVDHLPLLSLRAGDAYHGADSIAIAPGAHQANLQPVVAIAAVVSVKHRGSVVVVDRDIEIAIAIVIAVGRSAGNQGL